MFVSRVLLFRLLLLSVICQSAYSSDWPQFRGPHGLGVAPNANTPVSWSNSDGLVWRRELPGAGASSPIAVGEYLYVTCYSGYGTGERNQQMEDLRLHVVSLNRQDGEVVWDTVILPRLPVAERVRDHGYAAPTPASDGEALYIYFGRTGLFRFDLEGNQIWHADAGGKTHGWGCGASPILYENLVIVNASVESNSMIAFDKQTGDELWRVENIRRSWSTPHLVKLDDGSVELVLSIKDFVLGFDPATGQELWRSEGIHDYVCPSVVSDAGIVYASGGRQSRTIAIRAGGRGDVTESHRVWTAKAGANVVSPVIYEGHLYWVSDRNKVAYCVRLSDGHIAYAKRFPDQPYASALAADGKIYVVTRWGGTYVLEAKPAYELLAHNRLKGDDSTFDASPIVSADQLFLRSNRFLYCLGEERARAEKENAHVPVDQAPRRSPRSNPPRALPAG